MQIQRFAPLPAAAGRPDHTHGDDDVLAFQARNGRLEFIALGLRRLDRNARGGGGPVVHRGAGRTITQFNFPQPLEDESIRGLTCDDQADDELAGVLTGIQDGDALGNVQRRGQRPSHEAASTSGSHSQDDKQSAHQRM